LANGREVVGADSVSAYYDPKLEEARIELLKRDPKFSL
jgi:UDP-glucuronate 4-epimerase